MRRKFLRRGDLKYVLLELLQAGPMHGYEMMKALQEQTGGVYTPSPGSVYPILQMLEERGCVTVSDVDGKKVYRMTDAGRAFLAEGWPEERVDFGRREFWHVPKEEWGEVATFWQEVREVVPLFGRAFQRVRRDPEKLRRLRTLLEQMRTELAAIAGE
jgi:DNA-binding PadR family transcriptional regulator